MAEIKKIGFVGTGIMGAAMAEHFLDAGFQVSVYNRTKSKAEKLIERGAIWCETAGACAKNQDVVITMVGYPKDVEQIYFAEDGILNSASAGTFLVDMTTSSPELAEKIFAAAQEKNLHALDAPVTGGDIGAKNATLTILVGGNEKDFETLKPVFEVIGKNIVYEGNAGAGQKTKACNQIAIAGTLAGVCEAFAYAKASGLDIQKVFDAISSGAAGSFQMSSVAKKGLDGDFNPGFMLKHFAKDISIAINSSNNFNQHLPILEKVFGEIKTLEDDGHGSEGTQALLKFYNVK